MMTNGNNLSDLLFFVPKLYQSQYNDDDKPIKKVHLAEETNQFKKNPFFMNLVTKIIKLIKNG